MLDIKWIRDNQKVFTKGLTDRGFDNPQQTLDQILKRDEQRRATIQELQEAQARRNAASKEIGAAKQAKDEAAAKRLKDEVAALKTTIQEGEAKEREHDKAFSDLLATIPLHLVMNARVGLYGALELARRLALAPSRTARRARVR